MPDQPARPVFGKAENVLGESEEEDGLEEMEVEQRRRCKRDQPHGDCGPPVDQSCEQNGKDSRSRSQGFARWCTLRPDRCGRGVDRRKSKAAAYKRLRSALTENPVAIYENIEKNMEADFHQTKSAPGASLQAMSSRAWVEHPTKVMSYPSSIRRAIWPASTML